MQCEHTQEFVSHLGSIYTEGQHQRCNNAVVTLKTMESIKVGCNPNLATALFSTRMHSSRMCTTCLLTISAHALHRGVSTQGGLSKAEGCLLRGDVF